MRPFRFPFTRLELAWDRYPTDNELIAAVRQHVAFVERWRWWLVAVGVGCGILYAEFALPMVVGMWGVGPSSLPQVLRVNLEFSAGVATGFVLMAPVFLGVVGLMNGLKPLHTERLLLKYHDALQAREGETSVEERRTPEVRG